MPDGIPRTLAALRKEVAELREIADAESEAIVTVLHKLDSILAIIRDHRPSGNRGKGAGRGA